jgi:hypothetical protein
MDPIGSKDYQRTFRCSRAYTGRIFKSNLGKRGIKIKRRSSRRRPIKSKSEKESENCRKQLREQITRTGIGKNRRNY